MYLYEHLNGIILHYNRYINSNHYVFVIGRSGRYIVPTAYWFSVKSTRALSAFRVSCELYDSLYIISTSSPMGGRKERGEIDIMSESVNFNL